MEIGIMNIIIQRIYRFVNRITNINQTAYPCIHSISQFNFSRTTNVSIFFSYYWMTDTLNVGWTGAGITMRNVETCWQFRIISWMVCVLLAFVLSSLMGSNIIVGMVLGLPPYICCLCETECSSSSSPLNHGVWGILQPWAVCVCVCRYVLHTHGIWWARVLQ